MKHVLLFEKFGIIDSVVAKTDEAFKDLSSALIDISNTEYESKTINNVKFTTSGAYKCEFFSKYIDDQNKEYVEKTYVSTTLLFNRKNVRYLEKTKDLKYKITATAQNFPLKTQIINNIDIRIATDHSNSDFFKILKSDEKFNKTFFNDLNSVIYHEFIHNFQSRMKKTNQVNLYKDENDEIYRSLKTVYEGLKNKTIKEKDFKNDFRNFLFLFYLVSKIERDAYLGQAAFSKFKKIENSYTTNIYDFNKFSKRIEKFNDETIDKIMKITTTLDIQNKFYNKILRHSSTSLKDGYQFILKTQREKFEKLNRKLLKITHRIE